MSGCRCSRDIEWDVPRAYVVIVDSAEDEVESSGRFEEAEDVEEVEVVVRDEEALAPKYVREEPSGGNGSTNEEELVPAADPQRSVQSTSHADEIGRDDVPRKRSLSNNSRWSLETEISELDMNSEIETAVTEFYPKSTPLEFEVDLERTDELRITECQPESLLNEPIERSGDRPTEEISVSVQKLPFPETRAPRNSQIGRAHV